MDSTSSEYNIILDEENFDFGINLKHDEKIFYKNTFIIKGYYGLLNNFTNYTYKPYELKTKICNPKNFTSYYESLKKKHKIN